MRLYRVPAGLVAGQPVQLCAAAQRFAVGATLAQHSRGPGSVLLGPDRRAVVPARRAAEQDEKMLRAVGPIQRDKGGVRVVARGARRVRSAGRFRIRFPAV